MSGLEASGESTQRERWVLPGWSVKNNKHPLSFAEAVWEEEGVKWGLSAFTSQLWLRLNSCLGRGPTPSFLSHRPQCLDCLVQNSSLYAFPQLVNVSLHEGGRERRYHISRHFRWLKSHPFRFQLLYVYCVLGPELASDSGTVGLLEQSCPVGGRDFISETLESSCLFMLSTCCWQAKTCCHQSSLAPCSKGGGSFSKRLCLNL